MYPFWVEVLPLFGTLFMIFLRKLTFLALFILVLLVLPCTHLYIICIRLYPRRRRIAKIGKVPDTERTVIFVKQTFDLLIKAGKCGHSIKCTNRHYQIYYLLIMLIISSLVCSNLEPKYKSGSLITAKKCVQISSCVLLFCIDNTLHRRMHRYLRLLF